MKEKHMMKISDQKTSVSRVEQYDVVSWSINVNTGIHIGQLLRCDTKEAVLTEKQLFGGKAVKKVMAAMTKAGNGRKTAVVVAADEEDKKPRRLK